jgi:uncharacterized repeat protein (TIGR01451 family)
VVSGEGTRDTDGARGQGTPHGSEAEGSRGMRNRGTRSVVVLLGALLASGVVGVAPAAARTATATTNSGTARVGHAGAPRHAHPTPLKHPVRLSAAEIERFKQLEARAGHRSPLTPIAPGSSVTATRSLESAAPARALAPSDFSVIRAVDLGGGANIIPEPSEATDGRGILMTWNATAAVSTDFGSTFTYFDPSTLFANSYGGFCCDQVAVYDPSRDLFIWVLQYFADGSGNNAERIAVARGRAAMAAGQFYYWDITPQQIGAPSGTNYDQNKLALSNDRLWLEATQYGTASGSVVMTFSLDDLDAGAGLGYQFFGTLFSPGFTQGARDTMYFAAHVDTDTLRIYRWTEGSGTIFWDDVNHTSYPQTYPYRCPRTGGSATSDWCQRRSFGGGWAHTDRIFTGWVANGVIGFAWDASQGTAGFGTFNYPYTHVARFAESTRALIDQPIVWNGSFAWQYFAVAPNARGDLGGTTQYGGGSLYQNCALEIADEYTGYGFSAAYGITSDSDPTDTLSGDYLTARGNGGNPRTWSGTCYVLRTTGATSRPFFVAFGRARDDPRADLGLSLSAPATATVGTSFTYNLGVYNYGPARANGVSVTNTLPPSVSLVSAPGCSSAGTIRCDATSLPRGASVAWSITVRPLAAGSIVDRASVSQTDVHFDPDPSDNAQALTTTVSLPAATMTQPAGAYQTGYSFPVAWTSTGAGTVRYDVRYRAAPPTAGFGSFIQWQNATPVTSDTFTGAGRGKTYCFASRTRDQAWNASAWSAERCTSTPLDDRALGVVSGTWSRLTGAAYLNGTYSESTQHGAVLQATGVRGRSFGLIVGTCPTCGSIEIRWNGTLIQTASLVSGAVATKVLVTTPPLASVQAGTLTVRVSSASGKPVRIDGLDLLQV